MGNLVKAQTRELVEQQPLYVFACTNPFNFERKKLQIHDRRISIQEIITDLQPNYEYRRGAFVSVNGEIIKEDDWSYFYPAPGSVIDIRTLPKGFIAPIIMAIASIAASAGAGAIGTALGWGAVAIGLASAAAGLAVSVVGYLIMNALVRPPRAASPTYKPLSAAGAAQSLDTGRDTPTNYFTGTQNSAVPYGVIPRVYGKIRMVPPLAAQGYTELANRLTVPFQWVGETEATKHWRSATSGSFGLTDYLGEDQYLTMAVCWGYGPVIVRGIRIATTDLATYQDYTWEHREGYPEDEPLKTYLYDVYEEALEIQLEYGVAQTRVTQQDCNEISIDIAFTGLFQTNPQTGQKNSMTVGFTIEYRLAGTGTWGSGYTFNCTSSRTSTVRRGFRWAVDPGQYEVRITRGTQDYTSQYIHADSYWVLLRSVKHTQPVKETGIALSALRIKATDQLQGTVDELNGLVSSVLLDWDRLSGRWVLRETNNPASIIRDILMGTANSRPLAESRVDLENLQDFHTWCSVKNYYCNYIVESSVSVWDILNLVAACGRAALAVVNGKWGVVIDRDQDIPVQHFTPRNSWDFKATQAFVEELHGFRVTWLNEEEDYTETETTVYMDGYNAQNASKFEDLPLEGVTNYNQVYGLARYFLAVGEHRRETITFSTDFEHIVCQRGDRIKFSHDVMLIGIQSGRVYDLIDNGTYYTHIVIDELVEMAEGLSYNIRCRLIDGTSVLYNINPYILSDYAVHGDLPAYGIVPQLDHYWDLNNAYTDSPGPGKTAINLDNYGGAGSSWTTDWASRSTQAITTGSGNSRWAHTYGNADITQIGSTFSIIFTITTGSSLAGGGNVFYCYDAAYPNENGFGVQPDPGGGGWLNLNIADTPDHWSISTPILTINTTYQFVWVLTGGLGYIYINGEFYDSGAQGTPGTITGADPYLVVADGFNGKIHQLGIIKGKALTADQIQDLYNTWVDCGDSVYKRYPNDPEARYFAVHDVLPSYNEVPQPNHHWAFDGDLSDTEKTGEADLTFDEWTAGPEYSLEWVDDWAGRANRGIREDGGSFAQNSAAATITGGLVNPGPNWSAVSVFKTQPTTLAYDFSILDVGYAANGGEWKFGVGVPGGSTLSIYSQASGWTDTRYGPVGPTLATNTVYHAGITVQGGAGGTVNYYLNGELVTTGTMCTLHWCKVGVYRSVAGRSGTEGYSQSAWTATCLSSDQIKILYDTWVEVNSTTYKRHPDDPETLTPETETDTLELTTPVSMGTDFPEVGDLYTFGEAGTETEDFIVNSIEPGPDLTATIECTLYAPAVFTADVGPIPEYVPKITVPLTWQTPVVDTIASDGSVLIWAQGTWQSRILVSFTYPNFLPNYTGIEGWFRKTSESGEGGWTAITTSLAERTISLLPVEDGATYEMKFRFVKANNNRGPWTSVYTHTVLGKTDPPADVTGLSASYFGGIVNIKWAKVADVDVQAYELRYGEVGSNWESSTVLVQALAATTALTAMLPQGTWDVFIKAIDVVGNYSDNAASVTIEVPSTYQTVYYQAHTGWPGTRTNYVKNVVSGHLNPKSTAIATGTNFSLFNSFVYSPYSMSVYTGATITLGAEDTIRAYAFVQGVQGAGETKAFAPITQINTGSGWQNWTIGDVTCTAIRFRFYTLASLGLHSVSSFGCYIDKEPITESDEKTIAASGTTITFSAIFYTKPLIQISAAAATGGKPRIASYSSLTKTSFVGRIHTTNGTAVGGQLIYTATSRGVL